MNEQYGKPLINKLITAIAVSLLILSGNLFAKQTALNSFVQEHFPEEYAEQQAKFGLKRQTTNSSIANQKVLVLIHGLDDPDKVWMNLQPALIEQGYDVWRFEYPDDQPIHDSARLLYQQLIKQRPLLGEQVEIIAHSMGGLVSREMLTHPEFNCESCLQRRPIVDRLIMVGTPNHGSELVRFRYLSEVRDQLFSDDFHWLGGIVDGNGEAGEDLIPGSHFLTQLNSRPHPAETEYVAIAGMLTTNELSELMLQLEPLNELGRKVQQISEPIMKTVGDGLVSIESATLKGVKLYKVTGTHLSIIRNIFEQSERIPPAMPLIQKLLVENKED